LEIGVRSQNNGQWVGDARATQIFVVIDYTPVAGDTTTVGTGSDPSGVTRCPGDGATEIDAFTLQTSAGTDTVTDVTVTLSEGWEGIALVEITDDGGGTVYGSVADPVSNVVSINLGTTILADINLTQYKVRITPKTHANMPVPSLGATYNVTGTVTNIISTNTKIYNDTDVTADVIDNQSNDVTGVSGSPGDSQVVLNWTNPGDADFDQVLILRNTASITDVPEEGNTTYTASPPDTIGSSMVVYVGPLETFTDTNVSNGTAYWYKIFARDNCANYSVGVETGPHTPALPGTDGTVGGNSTANASSCNQITVTSFFTGDDNGNGTTTVEYNTINSFPATVACSAVSGPSPRQCLITGLLASTNYFVKVTFNDADGVSGTNGQVVSRSTPSCNGTDNAAPTVLILAPAKNGVVGGTDKVKIQIYDANGLAASNPVQWSVDGGPLTTTDVALNPNYAGKCEANCDIYEITLDTTPLSNGLHQLTVQVTDAGSPTANVALIEWPFWVNNTLGGQAAGSGLILRRTQGSQLCIDCHDLPTHSSQKTGTGYGNWAVNCTDCHTAHRTRNIFLIGEDITTPNSGAQTVQFHFDAGPGGNNPGSAPGNFSFLGDRSQGAPGSNEPFDDGICETCHTKTSWWRNNASADHTHNEDKRCIDCHAHEDGFAGAGSCLGCHGEVQGSRRIVTDDFDDAQTESHHVGTGSAFMGGNLTDFDCVVCHAEGNAVDLGGGQWEVQQTSWHNDGLGVNGNHRIDLKDSDNTGTVYNYDKDCLFDAAAPCNGPGATVANWGSMDAQWRTETSSNLDPFCLSCHDLGGATQARNEADPECSGGDSLNPFCDGFISNNYDQVDRGRVVDIRSKVDVNEAGGPLDRDMVGEARGPDGIADPPDGIYSRHAIRGFSTSVYTNHQIGSPPDETMWEQNLFIQEGVNDDGGRPLWNDTSVMGCGDCHTVDGANGAAGNAHGSDSEYLLKDASGGATEGTYVKGSTYTYVCYRCHTSDRYSMGETLGDHTGNDGDWQDKTSLLGVDRRDDGKGSSIFAMTCLNCHGGFGAIGSPAGFGTIHGTSDVLGVGEDGGGDGAVLDRRTYRFMNGASLRYFNPEGWTGTAVTCFTLGTADTFGGCTQHGGKSGAGLTKPIQRPLSY
jgi:hypothetical protein